MALSPRVTGLFLNYAWPGNIRQLHNAIQFSMVKCRGTLIEPDHMPPEILKAVPRREYAEQEGDRPKGPGRRPKLDVGEVSDALRRTGGNKAKTARILGVGRATLYNFLDAHPQLRTLVSD